MHSARKRANCWEVMMCGREPGGARVDVSGVCPAAAEKRLDGVNHGKNGGRACWGVPDTHCLESLSQKFGRCLDCPFFQQVEQEEDRHFVVMKRILQRLGTPARKSR